MRVAGDASVWARAETARTFRRSRFVPVQRVLAEAWPLVLPLCEGGPPAAVQQRTETAECWRAAIAAFDELFQYRDRDTLLRRSVELLRSALGLERVAIFALSGDGQRLFGTWGTGADGETTDERDIAFDVGVSHREAFAHARSGSAQWSRFAGVPLFAQTKRGTVVLRRGENVIIPIPGQAESYGILACDWGITGRSADAEALLRATVATRVLAPLLQLSQLSQLVEPGRRLHATPTRAQASSTQTHSDAELAARAASAIEADPSLERLALAKQLGTTPDKLGRAFKAVLAESLSDYRNRKRVTRFLAVADPSGGNLLQAALEAGFGSYAQFHRAFRKVFARSPIDYLRGASASSTG